MNAALSSGLTRAQLLELRDLLNECRLELGLAAIQMGEEPVAEPEPEPPARPSVLKAAVKSLRALVRRPTPPAPPAINNDDADEAAALHTLVNLVSDHFERQSCSVTKAHIKRLLLESDVKSWRGLLALHLAKYTQADDSLLKTVFDLNYKGALDKQVLYLRILRLPNSKMQRAIETIFKKRGEHPNNAFKTKSVLANLTKLLFYVGQAVSSTAVERCASDMRQAKNKDDAEHSPIFKIYRAFADNMLEGQISVPAMHNVADHRCIRIMDVRHLSASDVHIAEGIFIYLISTVNAQYGTGLPYALADHLRMPDNRPSVHHRVISFGDSPPANSILPVPIPSANAIAHFGDLQHALNLPEHDFDEFTELVNFWQANGRTSNWAREQMQAGRALPPLHAEDEKRILDALEAKDGFLIHGRSPYLAFYRLVKAQGINADMPVPTFTNTGFVPFGASGKFKYKGKTKYWACLRHWGVQRFSTTESATYRKQNCLAALHVYLGAMQLARKGTE